MLLNSCKKKKKKKGEYALVNESTVMPFTVFPLKLEIDILSAINILILIVLFKMIGNTKCPFIALSLLCVCFFLYYYGWTGCQA